MTAQRLRGSGIAIDVRSALRGWRRRPMLAATLMCTLALGLGLGAGILSFADGYLFRPLPFPDPDPLYLVRDPHGAIARALVAADTDALRRTQIGGLGFVDWSTGTRVSGDELIIADRHVPIRTYDVTPGFGQTLRVPLVAGRLFEDADHQDGSTVAAWLSYRFWQREFGGDRAILNRSYRTSGPRQVEVTMVGVLDRSVASFDLNNPPPDLIVPAVVDPSPKVRNPLQLSFPIVRLPTGMTRAEGEAMISTVLQAVAPASDGRVRVVQLQSLHDTQVSGGAPTARVFFAAALLVLLLVSINLVHLLLAQSVARADEVATRAALGASRWRIACLFLTESAILGVVGVTAGLVLGAWLSDVIASRIPQDPTAGRNLALVPVIFDGRIVTSVAIVGLAIALFGGMWPAWRAGRRPLHLAMRGSAGIASALSSRFSRAVLASELGVATVVLMGAVFIGQGIWTYLYRPLGFSYAGRIAVTVGRPAAGTPTPVDPRAWASIRQAMAAIPGVKAVGAYDLGEGRPVEIRGAVFPDANAYDVGDGYFEAWQVRLAAGRLFSAEEIRTEAPVAVVDAAFARRAWPGAQAIGENLRVDAGQLRRVVGVVDTQVRSLRSEALGEAYIPRAETARWSRLVAWAAPLSAPELVDRLTPVVATLLPGASVRAEPVTLVGLFNRQTGEAEFQWPIMIAFAALTLVLTGIAVFGLVSYLVAQRTREFGIRLALGARRRDIWQTVGVESVAPAAAGVLVGSAAAWALDRFVRAGAFGWTSSGITAVIVVSVMVLGVAILAATGPARRTLRIDPSVVLRGE